jgi:hypothetical protein
MNIQRLNVRIDQVTSLKVATARGCKGHWLVSFSKALYRARISKRLRILGIDSKESIPPAYVACPEILEQSIGAKNRVRIGLSYRTARLQRLGIDSWAP